MAYQGHSVPIHLGALGLRTDDPMTALPPNALIKANNVSFHSGRIEKDAGSSKLNATALPTGVVAVTDWWPTPSLQRTIAVCSSGKVYRDTGAGTFNSNTAIRDFAATLTPDVHMCVGGQEAATNNKKLFIFTGSAQIHRITGDGAATAAISTPNVDWAASGYPTFGLMYQQKMCAFGSGNNRHTIYFSLSGDHEDYNTTPLTFPIFPGEGDGIVAGFVHLGLLFLFKKPFGVYVFDGRDPLSANWTVSKYSDSFGIQSPHAVIAALSDLIIANSFGSYTSLQSSQRFGSFEAGDILANNHLDDYIRGLFNRAGFSLTQSVYYAEKKKILFSAQSSSADTRDRMIVMDMSREQLRISIDTKEQPNCLALKRDGNGILKPMYGDKNGFVWLMDQASYNRAGLPYLGEFQTAYTDFSFADPALSGKNKIFEFLDVQYVSTGTNSFYCDVYVDGKFRHTLTFNQRYGVNLGTFLLGTDSLAGTPVSARNRKRMLSCTGNKISFRFYNGNSGEAFKIERIVCEFRPSGEEVYSAQTTSG